jgi:glutamine cyclotransferase
LQYIDPVTFQVTKTLEVFAGSETVTNLNELEFIRGEIWANVWHSDRIARIDPKSGQVTAWIDLTAIAERETHEQEDVLNGIAWDSGRQRLFVTGKDWSKLYEIVVK